jgi:hypothetical protein
MQIICRYRGTGAEAIHSLIGFATPQSKHFVTVNWALQFGQTPRVWKVSKACPQWLHFQ